MPALLYDAAGANSLWIFLLTTVVMGGATAFVSGRVIAETWRPFWQVPLYMLLIAATVRFIQYALFQFTFLAPRSFLVDYLVAVALASLGYRIARARQMATQYSWLGGNAGGSRQSS